MPAAKVNPSALRVSINPDSLVFTDTSELLEYPLPWIGQDRAEIAARFGLGIDQPGYNLFVLGEVGSGRSSLLQEVMKTVAATRAASEARALTKERRGEIDQAAQELRTEITHFMEKMRPVERVMNEGLAALQRQVVKPLLDHEMQDSVWAYRRAC